jgi:uncharacterized protein (DUF302 family)
MRNNPSYGYTKSLGKMNFTDALARVTDALKKEGFGVITEIDVKKTVKEKLGKEFREYRILGACNPPLAHQALSDELFIGLLLPCNVIVFAEDDGAVTISIGNPKEMFKIVDNPKLMPLAEEVDGRLKKVFAALQS